MTIVVGHDGSDSGDDAAVAGRAARARDRRGACSSSPSTRRRTRSAIGRVDAEWVAYMREQAEEVSAAREALPGGARRRRRSTAWSARGSAAHGLDDVAEAEHASMIVVGSARHGARRRISPGSTGERLLHGAICPVAVAPRGLRERPSDAPVQRIGVGFVDSPEAREAVQVAARAGGARRARR